MSKETLADISTNVQKAIAEAEARKAQEAVRQEKEETRREAERQALLAQNEARLRATGIVDLFEQLRDSGVLRMSDKPVIERRPIMFLGIEIGQENIKIADYIPASVELGRDNTEVSILFDRSINKMGDVDSYEFRVIIASLGESGELCVNSGSLGESGGRLCINGNRHEVTPEDKLADVVTKEILKLKGLAS